MSDVSILLPGRLGLPACPGSPDASREISSRLPSLTQLTAETSLATGTVRRAIDVPAREHLVQTVPARGTFVTGSGRPARWSRSV